MSLQPAQSPGAPAPAPTDTTKEERQWAMYAHIAAPVICILGASFHGPLWSFAAPLAIYLIKKNESDFIATHAREAANFTITLILLTAALYFGLFHLAVKLQDLTGTTSTILMILTTIIALGSLSLYAIAALKAHEGKPHRYPLTLRIIR